MKEFDKVIGYEDVKIELERIVDMMVCPDKYQNLGVTTTRGLLLHGEPGTGKTLMATCFIEASHRPTYTIRKTLPDGEFVKYIRDTFEQAVTNAPSIVFMDDMDKFANEDEWHLNAEEFVTIQSCIDDCKGKEVFFLATTNDLRAIPRSLLRSGRFDKTIVVKNPTGKDAEKIVAHYLKNKKCSSDVDSKGISRLLYGRSCADLETVINEAGVYAAFDNQNEIRMNDMVRAFMRIVYKAPEKTKPSADKYIRQTAIHEAGHAVITEILEPNSVPIVTIKPHNSDIRGFTLIENDDDYFADKQFMENRVLALLGGKAAIEVLYGITDVGCNDDIHRAIKIVERFVDHYCTYGFHAFESICENDPDSLRQSKASLISYEMERYYQQAKRLIIENRNFVEKLADELVNREVLLEKDIQAIKSSNR